MRRSCSSLALFLSAALFAITTQDAAGQLHRLPIPITDWQSLENYVTVHNGELFVKSLRSEVFGFNGQNMRRIAPESGTPERHVAQFLESVGDYIYYASPEEIWRTDGTTAESVLRLPDNRRFRDGDANIYLDVNRLGDSIYLTSEFVGSDGSVLKIGPDGVTEFPTPLDLPGGSALSSNSIGLQNAIVISGEERPADNSPGSTYMVIRGDSLAVLATRDLGLDDDDPHAFHVVGVSDTHIYLVWRDKEFNTNLYRSDLDSTEYILTLPDDFAIRYEVFEKGETIYFLSDGNVTLWSQEGGFREANNPHPDGTYYEPHALNDVTTWWGNTTGLVSSFLDGRFKFARPGENDLELIPDIEALQAQLPDGDGQVVETPKGWCEAGRLKSEIMCMTNGQAWTSPVPLTSRMTEFEGRLYFLSRGSLHSVSASEGEVDYRLEVATISDEIVYLGKLGDSMLLSAGHHDSPAGPVLWSTNGRDAEVVDPTKIYPSVAMTDGQIVVIRTRESLNYRSPGELWTFDGQSIGSAADYLGPETNFDIIYDYGQYRGDLLFTVEEPAEKAGLWRRTSSGTTQLASYGQKIMIADSTAYFSTTDFNRSIIRVYDEAGIRTVAEFDGGVEYAIAGGDVLVAAQNELWVLRDGQASTIEGFYNIFSTSEWIDGYLYFIHQNDDIWRTNGDVVELYVEVDRRFTHLASHDGRLYWLEDNSIMVRNEDGSITEISTESKGRRPWIFEKQDRLIARIDNLLYLVEDNELKLLSEERLGYYGTVGNYVLVQKVNENGEVETPGLFSIDLTGSSVSNEYPPVRPTPGFTLESYPNPVQSRATIRLTSGTSGPVLIEVTDALGRRTSTLHQGILAAGEHTFTLDARTLAAGVYFVRVASPDVFATKPIVVPGTR